MKLLRFLVLSALAIATAASAQSFPQPPDVPAYVTVTPTYAAGTTLNVVNTGTPPAAAYELSDIATSESGWTGAGSTQCLAVSGGACPEAKFRTLISAGGSNIKMLFDDPIRNYGQPGTSHCHIFFGNLSANAYSTYATLRNRAREKSMSAGGPLNGTAYWFPCPIKTNPFGDGKNYAVKPIGNIIVYYVADPSESPTFKRLLLGLRYVAGTNMDDPDQNWLQSIITTANAQPGTSGRYALSNSGNLGYTLRWTCSHLGTDYAAKWLKNSDGSDPFGGNCQAGDDLWMQFSGPDCWDGTNLWSPGGYRHVIPGIWDTVANKFVCPNNWYKIPALVLQIHFTHSGFSDYGNWRLSSDDAAATNAGHAIRNGESFHTDWFNGWDRATLTSWLQNCIGIEGGTPRQCDSSATGNTAVLITNVAAPTGRSPQIQSGSGGTATAGAMFELPAGSHNGMPDTLNVGGAAMALVTMNYFDLFSQFYFAAPEPHGH